jgi:hypothetical protein
MKDIKKLLEIEDPVKRRVMFIAIFSREVVNRGGKPPIIVGGEAVEIYTQGSYTTGDIDIKSPFDLTEAILKEWRFTKAGRVWFNKELDIYIDWLGSSLEEGDEAEKRVNTIKITKELEIKVISIEDLVIDRLNASKWWGDSDSLMWAKVLINIKRAIDKVDEDYLMKRAEAEDLKDVLEKIL